MEMMITFVSLEIRNPHQRFSLQYVLYMVVRTQAKSYRKQVKLYDLDPDKNESNLNDLMTSVEIR